MGRNYRKKNQNPGDSNRYYDWLERAGEDIISSHVLLQDDRCYNNSAFHAQQAIEKALKAYLLLLTGRRLDGHNLTWLCRQAARFDERFFDWVDESAKLNQCYIETRYPTDVPMEISYAEALSAYTMARDMYLFVCQKIDEDYEHFKPPKM